MPRGNGPDRQRAIVARPSIESKTVKSATRALEILEFFDDVQREATVMEVAAALAYPQSSTSALLRSLTAIGYLEYNRRTRMFVTSVRVALLGRWVGKSLYADGKIIRLMAELNEHTGDTIILARRVGLFAHYIHVIQATNPARFHMTLGTARPLVHSGVGYALLTEVNEAEIMRLALRYDAVFAPRRETLDPPRDLVARVKRFRAAGYAFSYDLHVQGGGVIASLLPEESGQPRLAVGIAGITHVLKARQREFATLLRESIERHFPG